jgi:release factor glutamine methyltransferase
MWISAAVTKLAEISESPNLEAQVIAAHILQKPRSWLITHDDQILESQQQNELELTLARLLKGEPLPYILGKQEFFGLEFSVNPSVLIPRPETERLIELTLDWLSVHPEARHGMDIGTGSGCIAITLCKQQPDLQITAVDISAEALLIAQENAARHQVTQQMNFLQADLLPSSMPTPDFLCANLPYIPEGRLADLPVARHEPTLALAGGEDGFGLISRLLTLLSPYAIPFMIFEMDDTHAPLALSAAKAAFPKAQISIQPDLTERDRFLVIEHQTYTAV